MNTKCIRTHARIQQLKNALHEQLGNMKSIYTNELNCLKKLQYIINQSIEEQAEYKADRHTKHRQP